MWHEQIRHNLVKSVYVHFRQWFPYAIYENYYKAHGIRKSALRPAPDKDREYRRQVGTAVEWVSSGKQTAYACHRRCRGRVLTIPAPWRLKRKRVRLTTLPTRVSYTTEWHILRTCRSGIRFHKIVIMTMIMIILRQVRRDPHPLSPICTST
jgi:hypothetical protein